jgi:WD40 repeat protein
VDRLALSPDLKFIAAKGTYGELTLWSAVDHTKLQTLSLTDHDTVGALIFASDAQSLIALQEDYCAVWDVTGSRELSRILTGHTDKIWALAVDPTSTLVASGDRDKRVMLWRVKDGARIDPPIEFGHWVKSLAFNPSGDLLAVGYDDGSIVIWRVSDHQQSRMPLYLHTKSVNVLELSPDGKYLASGSADHKVVILHLETSTRSEYEHDDIINGLDFSSDGRLLVSSGDDNKIVLWNIESKRIVQTIDTAPNDAEHVRFIPNGWHLAWSDGTGIVFWSVGASETERSYSQGQADQINSLAFSFDRRMIACATMDNKVALWDRNDLERLPHSLEGHSDIVWRAIFANKGNLIVSCSNDKRVRIWDVGCPALAETGERNC